MERKRQGLDYKDENGEVRYELKNGVHSMEKIEGFSAEEFSSIMNAHVQGRHLLTLIVVGGFIVLLAVGISIFPTLRTNPRDTLSRMEG